MRIYLKVRTWTVCSSGEIISKTGAWCKIERRHRQLDLFATVSKYQPPTGYEWFCRDNRPQSAGSVADFDSPTTSYNKASIWTLIKQFLQQTLNQNIKYYQTLVCLYIHIVSLFCMLHKNREYRKTLWQPLQNYWNYNHTKPQPSTLSSYVI